MSTLKPLWIILQQGSRGRILRNYRSRVLQFEFGNIMLRFDAEGFRRFAEFVAGIDPADCSYPSCRCGKPEKLAIELHPTGVVMTVDRKEAAELRDAVRDAWSVLRLTLSEFRSPHFGN